jgi:hypothetical protein
MACQKVEAGIGRTGNVAEIRIGRHGLQEPGRGKRIVARFADHLDTDGIGLKLLIA